MSSPFYGDWRCQQCGGRGLIAESVVHDNDCPFSPARKADSGKARTDLLPPVALLEAAKGMTHGAKEYGDNNWRKGMAWHRIAGAALRHILKFMSGQDIDPDSGVHHMALAADNCLMLCECSMLKIGTDDRGKS